MKGIMLDKAISNRKDETHRGVDPLTLSVVASKLNTITDEMAIVVLKTARSPIFAEANDFSCLICNWDGEMVTQHGGIPAHAACGFFTPRAVMQKYKGSINDGDVFLVNDPYSGSMHLADMVVVTPVFYQEELVFFTLLAAHHADIGGPFAGSYNPLSESIFHEGVRIVPIKIIDRGKANEEVMDLIKTNTRSVTLFESDILAQIGACSVGKRRLVEMIKKYSLPKIKEVVSQWLDNSEKITRGYIRGLPNGVYRGEEMVDDDGFSEDPFYIKVSITVNDEAIDVDFTGTSPQARGFINSSLPCTTSLTYAALMWVLPPDTPKNSGSYRAFHLTAPEGSLVNPTYPAATSLGTLTAGGELMAAILRAFAEVVPEKIPGGSYVWCGPSFSGEDPRKKGEMYFGFAFPSFGGGGGKSTGDGFCYVPPLTSQGVVAPNIESNEVQYPQITLWHEFYPDSAGPGKFRGGPGVKYQFKFYGDSPAFAIYGDGVKAPRYGVKGGRTGRTNCPMLNYETPKEQRLKSKGIYPLAEDDLYTSFSSGGGGWGDPLERDPEKVAEDVRNEIASDEAAREIYGVVVHKDFAVDSQATKDLRETLKNSGST